MKTPKTLLFAFAILLFGTLFLLLENKSTGKKEIKTTKSIIEKKVKSEDAYDQVSNELNALHKKYSQISSLVKYGKSSEGRDCIYFKIGSQDKPKILIHSGLNGQEKQTTTASIQLLTNILKNQNDTEIKWLLENREIYFIPVVSPDAFVSGKDSGSSFPDGTKYEFMTASVKNLVELANDLKFKAVLNLHSNGQSIAKPNKVCSKDFTYVTNLVEKMSNLSGFKIENGNEIDTNWFYSTGSCSLTLNLKNKDLPQAYDAVITFIKEAAESDMNPQPIRPIFYQAD